MFMKVQKDTTAVMEINCVFIRMTERISSYTVKLSHNSPKQQATAIYRPTFFIYKNAMHSLITILTVEVSLPA